MILEIYDSKHKVFLDLISSYMIFLQKQNKKNTEGKNQYSRL